MLFHDELQMDDTDGDSDENSGKNPSAESNFCWDISAILDAVDEFDMVC